MSKNNEVTGDIHRLVSSSNVDLDNLKRSLDVCVMSDTHTKVGRFVSLFSIRLWEDSADSADSGRSTVITPPSSLFWQRAEQISHPAITI